VVGEDEGIHAVVAVVVGAVAVVAVVAVVAAAAAVVGIEVGGDAATAEEPGSSRKEIVGREIVKSSGKVAFQVRDVPKGGVRRARKGKVRKKDAKGKQTQEEKAGLG